MCVFKIGLTGFVLRSQEGTRSETITSYVIAGEGLCLFSGLLNHLLAEKSTLLCKSLESFLCILAPRSQALLLSSSSAVFLKVSCASEAGNFNLISFHSEAFVAAVTYKIK